MTLAQLKAFVEAYLLGSFSAAARALGTSQASVSSLVLRLEDELQVTLFQRDSRGLRPTAAAQALVPYAQEILSSAQAAQEALGLSNGLLSGSATFGVPRNARFYGLDDFSIEFFSDYPNVRLRLLGVNSSLVARDVARGDLEAGLVVLPVNEDGLMINPIAKDEVMLAVPQTGLQEHRDYLKDLEVAPLTVFQRLPMVAYDANVGWEDPTRRQLHEMCQQQGIPLDPIIEVEQVETALELVSRGAGVTIVSASLVRARAIPTGVRVIPFEKRITETLAIISQQGRLLSPAISEVINRVKKSVWSSFE